MPNIEHRPLSRVSQKLAELEEELLKSGFSTDLMLPVREALAASEQQFADERQRVLHKQAELQHRMGLAMDAAGIGIWELDLKTNALVWDKWMYRLYGIEPGTFSGAYEAWKNGLHPDDLEQAVRDVEEAVADVRPFDTRFRVIHPSGEVRYLKAYAVITRDREGGPLKMTGINYDITARTLAETKLLEQTKWLEGVIEATQAGTWWWNVETGETVFGDRWAGILGYSVEELTPFSIETWTRLVHPEDLSACQHELQKHFDGALPYYDCEMRMWHKDGAWRWVQARGKVTERGSDGRPLVMSGTHQDISERKRLERELIDKAKELDSLYNGITDAVFIADIETHRILDCNHVAEKLMELDRAALQRMHVEAVHPDDMLQFTMQAFARQARGEQRVVETEVQTSTGTRIPVSIMTSKLEFHERACLMGVFRDISESKEAEERIKAANQQLQASEQQLMAANQQLQASEQQLMAANQQLQASEQQLIAANQQLQASEAKYRLIFENLQDVYAEMDVATGLFDEISPSIIQYGYSRAEVLHSPARGYFAEVGEWEEFMNTLLTRRMLQDYELRFRKKDGSIVTGSLSVALYQFTHDSPLKVAGTIRDISARKDHELQIRENLKLKNDFISSVSHELRTPLFSILGFSSMLLKDNATIDSATRHEFTSIIHDESSRLSSLIEDLLTISRIEAGKAKYHPETFGLVGLVCSVVALFRRESAEKNLQLEEEYPAIEVAVRFDRDSLKQVVMNLLGNAMKFTLSGGSIKICVLLCSDAACIQVADTGIGIDPADRDKIFEKFYRSEHCEIHVDGTGLGLAIVKELLESQGGAVSVESELNRGSTFTVMLPLAASASEGS